MPVVKIYDQQKNEVGEMELAPEVFGVPIRPEILHLVVRAHLAALRSGTHSVKTRSFVSGGGKKPWRQKGTGRARAGSNRSPIWRHGAIVHGPQPRDYGFKVNKKVKALALKMALTARAVEDNLLVVDKIDLAEIKTKLFSSVVNQLGLKKALIVTQGDDNTLNLSARNIPGLKVMRAEQLNVYDILNYPQLVMLAPAAKDVQERFK
jgi:large subunit ribosomal protein L4